jgi:hypothetical protein
MIDPKTASAIKNYGPSKKVTMVVFVHSAEDLAQFQKEKDYKKRSGLISKYLEKKKNPYLKSLKKYQSRGLQVIDRLESSPQFILNAPVKTWRKLIEDRATIVTSPGVEVVLSEPEWKEVISG